MYYFFYSLGGSNVPVKGGTFFGGYIIERDCDIISFHLFEILRGHGLGREMYNVIERFSREWGCERVLTTPSGQGKGFWPHMGFGEILDDEFGRFGKVLIEDKNI